MPRRRPEPDVKTPSAEEILAAFGRALRRHRVDLRPFVSQERLAERAELHRTYTSSLERGEKNISLTRLVPLAAALGVPLSTLIASMERELRKAI